MRRPGANLIFNPEPENMYFDDFSTYVNIESLSEELCGKSQTNTFQGVGTVVSKHFYNCKSRQSLLWSKGCTAACDYKKNG